MRLYKQGMLASSYYIYCESEHTLNAASSSLIPCMVGGLSFNRQFCDTSACKNNSNTLKLLRFQYYEHIILSSSTCLQYYYDGSPQLRQVTVKVHMLKN